jgi:DNA mismatch repair protein MutH
MSTDSNSTQIEKFETLKHAVHSIAGKTLFEVADNLDITVPHNLLKNKGWIGQLIETALGVKNNSRPEPDFPEFGIELKTLPITANGKPKESTYVCVAPLAELNGLAFKDSLVAHKLAQVLWIPIQADKSIPLPQRRIGQGIFWKPNPQQYQTLVADFQEITDQIALGNVEQITAHQGSALQLRPKAANSKVLTAASNN